MFGNIIFKRKYGGSVFLNSENDRRLTKRDARKKAANYRKYGCNARVVHSESGYMVYKKS